MDQNKIKDENLKIEEIARQIVIMLDDLAFIQQVSGNGSIINSHILTNYFIKTFINAGLPLYYEPLQKAKEWCLKITEQHKEIDPFILHSLILLKEENCQYVQKMLEELRTWRRKSDGRFELPTGYKPQGDLFSTMFILDILLDLDDYTKYFMKEEIDKSIRWIIDHKNDIKEIKDVAFLLYLLNKYEYKQDMENLINEVYNNLNTLLQEVKNNIQYDSSIIFKNNNLENMLWITYDIIEIDNPQIKNIVGEVLNFLTNGLISLILQFYNPRNEFVLDENLIYFKTRIAFLFIYIFSKIYGKILKNNILEIILNQRHQTISKLLYDLRFGDKIREVERLTDLIKKWIKIDFENVIPLSGGLSGTRIYRVKSKITIPIYNQEFPLQSIIVKQSDEDTFEKELQNYQIIPKSLKKYFAEISSRLSLPASENIDVSGVYLIMQDLTDFQTFHEILKEYDHMHEQAFKEEKLKEELNRLIKYICMELKNLYENSKQRITKQTIMFYYFEDIFKSLSKLVGNGIEEDSFKIVIGYIQDSYTNIEKLNMKFTTFMHGDLNSRNIMIKITEDKYDFKLIDIDSLNFSGDYAFDIGELCVDILFGFRNIGQIVSEWIEKYFVDFAERMGDETFKERLIIAKIRSLIKLAKIFIGQGHRENAQKAIDEIVRIIHRSNGER